MSDLTINLNNALYQYLQQNSLREPAILQKLRAETHQMTGYQMQISPEQGQFMALLMAIIGAKKTLDIGTFTGYSAIAVALALPEDGKVMSFDIDESNTSVARKYFKEAALESKIQLQIGKASDSLQHLIDDGFEGTFDFAFIDADKNGYDDYYEKSLKLLRKGGLLAVDNVLWNGKVADPDNDEPMTKAIRALNAKILNDERVTISMIPIGDGLTLARKR